MTRLAAYRTLMNGDPTHPHEQTYEIGMLLVQQVLREERTRPSHLVRIANIIEVTCTRLAVNRSDLISTRRHRRIVIARAMVAYLARELTTMSYPEIAQALGRENHSTVHTADQRLRRQLAADEPLKLGGHEPAASLRELADLLRRDICRGVE